MPAQVPLDVDLEDRLIYGLTPIRFGYLVIAGLLGLAAWSTQSMSPFLRGPLSLLSLAAGAAVAWGRFRGRPVDAWLLDMTRFVLANYRVQLRRPRMMVRFRRRAAVSALEDRRSACTSPGLDPPP